MSYAEATLDLSSVPVVCLTGLNGAGKSALLDAITWVLWETARSGSDELIKLGAREMWVDLVFAHEGQRYRVRRSRQKLSVKAGARVTSKGNLEFQIYRRHEEPSLAITSGAEANSPASPLAIASGRESNAGTTATCALATTSNAESKPGKSEWHCPDSDGSWRSLTGPNMRQTQKSISDLLRMDFETFTNSAYLRQGKADEFTTRAPAERKQVLSEILGLSYFDQLQEKAREQVRKLKSQVEVLSFELHDLPNIQSTLAQTNKDLLETETKVEAMQCEWQVVLDRSKNLQHRISELELGKHRLEFSENHADSMRKDISSLEAREQQISLELEKVTAILGKEPELLDALARFESLKKEVERLDKNAFTAQELNSQRLTWQHQLATLRAKIELEHSSANSKYGELLLKVEKLHKDTSDKVKIGVNYNEFRKSVAAEALLADKQQAFTLLNARINELSAQIGESKIRLEAQLCQKENSLDEVRQLLASQENLANQKAELEAQASSLEKLETEFQFVEEKGLRVKSLIESKQNKIETFRLQQKEKLSKIEELHAHADSTICPLCAAPIVDRSAVVERYREEIDSIESQINAECAAIEGLEEERLELRKTYATLRAHLQRRQMLDTQIGQFNEKLLSIERAEQSFRKLQTEIESLRLTLAVDDYAQLQRESLIAVRAECHKLDFDPVLYANLQSQIRAQRHIEVRFQQLQKDLTELKRLEEEKPGLEARIRVLFDQLSSESYGMEERKKLEDVQRALKTIEYDRDRHLDLKNKLSALLPGTELLKEITLAVSERPKLAEALEQCRAQLHSKCEILVQIELDQKRIEEEVVLLPDLRQEFEKLQRHHVVLEAERTELLQQRAVQEAKCSDLKGAISDLSRAQKRLQNLNLELEDFEFLSEAFGKKGIQAVIIENAIPEIEAESNRILSRLTDNKMHVAFITQHKSKSGGIIETLDLVVGDDLGTRNYELFSGGEAYKVNFAVRVALARLLARRAGAKLETLIIDEGFGSQDEASRERLVRAIRAIQSEFARIIVITHMSDIKEMFPVQVHVSKRNGASQLQILY
jgi:exonuclease SbcC